MAAHAQNVCFEWRTPQTPLLANPPSNRVKTAAPPSTAPTHTGKPPDGHDNLTHCQINKEIRADILFSNVMADAYVNSGLGGTEDFKWAPERTKASWEPLKTGNGQGNWEAEFEEDLKKGFGDAAATPMAFMPFLRGSSEGLSFPMTILYGLQTLKSGDEWTKQKKLTVHVLGAFEKEIVLAQIFEEILHRLPQVQEIRIVLIGPELGKVIQDSSPMEMDTCPDCSRNERKRIHEHHALTYHDYVKKQGTRYTKPDIAVAFNSGCHESPSSWTETFKVLVQQGVTCLFTSYNQEEANQDSKLLQSSGIQTQLLGVKKNPWGSMKLANEPNRVYGFYSTNGWLAGGFSG
ncbi:hypothetical protein VNI00_015439 [Paramarasmius palmivorus]|uniref:Mitochondrial splicing suppressor 51-like C-terminal domain-containing protein n=1 Tax=Paramarasmius palmivorus TaxID=297713 RepID=A0AAW0BK13_9AGAR